METVQELYLEPPEKDTLNKRTQELARTHFEAPNVPLL